MRSEDHEKFKRLANKRVNNAIRYIRLIGNLSNKSNYDYSEEEVSKIFDALTAEMKSARSRFSSARKAAEEAFSLD